MELFAENGFRPIVLDGRTVHPMFRTSIREGDRFDVAWLEWRVDRPQGLRLEVRLPGVRGSRGRGGVLRIDRAESPVGTFWREDAPDVVHVECVRSKPGAELWISNRWRLGTVEHEWLNNFGMLIDEQSENTYVLHCSDGVGHRLTFGDLVVRIDFEPTERLQPDDLAREDTT
jgi:hypothetical protein